MTEERKQELRQLLEEARKSLEIRYRRKPISLPPDLYGKYLEERWTSYGVDFLSGWFSPPFTLDIGNKTNKSKLLDFIKKELAQYVDGNDVFIGRYRIEDGSFLDRSPYPHVRQSCLLERLLEIAIVRGIEESVSFFDRCSCTRGTQGFFQHVTLLGGIKLETEVQVFEGVRLVPPPSWEISQEVAQYLLGFPQDVYIYPEGSLVGTTLLVIDRPGISIFHEPAPDPTFPHGTRIDDLPFPIEVHNVKLPNMAAVHSFRILFCQIMSLVCNSPVKIIDGWLFFEQADKSFNPYTATINMLRHFNLDGRSAEAGEADIERATCLYDILDKNSDVREKLQIPIDRWIKSKIDKKAIDEITYENPTDKMIDLGIAFEALYVTRENKKGKQLRHRVSWYLGENPAYQKELETELEAIYDYRSDIVHNRELKEGVSVGEQSVSFSELVTRAQDLCRQSIINIMEGGKFPDWNNLRQDSKARWASS